MKYWNIKKFVNDHKGVIIGGAIGAVSLIGLGFGIRGNRKNFSAEAVEEDWDICRVVDPGAIWAAFDKDGNLVDAVTAVDGTLVDATDFMVFGKEVKK